MIARRAAHLINAEHPNGRSVTGVSPTRRNPAHLRCDDVVDSASPDVSSTKPTRIGGGTGRGFSKENRETELPHRRDRSSDGGTCHRRRRGARIGAGPCQVIAPAPGNSEPGIRATCRADAPAGGACHHRWTERSAQGADRPSAEGDQAGPDRLPAFRGDRLAIRSAAAARAGSAAADVRDPVAAARPDHHRRERCHHRHDQRR